MRHIPHSTHSALSLCPCTRVCVCVSVCVRSSFWYFCAVGCLDSCRVLDVSLVVDDTSVWNV